MSGALARLRQHFGDELLVRSGREYVLTPVASRLLPTVREALRQVERTLSIPPEFDPATSTRRFSLGVCGQSILTLSGLPGRVLKAAPRVSIQTRPVTAPLLASDRALLGHDLLIGPAEALGAPGAPGAPGAQAGGEHEVIARDRLVYLADPANSRLRDGRLTTSDLAALPHAAARISDTDPDAATAALQRLGITPNVVLTTTGWLPLPFLLTGTDLVAAVPERLARRVASAAGVTVIDPPFGTIELTETAWWHPMRATDPALTWLRTILRQTAAC
jgi:DNA-binding transcriptional LysR family regulator